jgi:hypothetical protein
MKILAVLALALALAGCATADTRAILDNLQGCERHYNGVVSAGLVGAGFSGSVKIDCNSGTVPPPAPAA